VCIEENMGKCIDVSQILVHRQRLISRLIPDNNRLIHVVVDYPLTYSRLTYLPGNSCALWLSSVTLSVDFPPLVVD